MDEASGQVAADEQIAEAMAAGHESLSLECRADAARLERLLAPDFHEFGASGGEIGYEETAERVAAATDPTASRLAWRTCGDGCWQSASLWSSTPPRTMAGDPTGPRCGAASRPANGRYSITKALSRPADRRTRAPMVP